MIVDRAKLKKIRWFSNGVWQFQPHLYFMQNMVGEDFPKKIEQMETGEVVNVNNNTFKMEIENGLE